VAERLEGRPSWRSRKYEEKARSPQGLKPNSNSRRYVRAEAPTPEEKCIEPTGARLVGALLQDFHGGIDRKDRVANGRTLERGRVLGHNLEAGSGTVDVIGIAAALSAMH
jgi:hypothetical protein